MCSLKNANNEPFSDIHNENFLLHIKKTLGNMNFEEARKFQFELNQFIGKFIGNQLDVLNSDCLGLILEYSNQPKVMRLVCKKFYRLIRLPDIITKEHEPYVYTPWIMLDGFRSRIFNKFNMHLWATKCDEFSLCFSYMEDTNNLKIAFKTPKFAIKKRNRNFDFLDIIPHNIVIRWDRTSKKNVFISSVHNFCPFIPNIIEMLRLQNKKPITPYDLFVYASLPRQNLILDAIYIKHINLLSSDNPFWTMFKPHTKETLCHTKKRVLYYFCTNINVNVNINIQTPAQLDNILSIPNSFRIQI